MAHSATQQKEQREKVNALLEKAGIEPKYKSGEKTLARKITDSSLYDGHPAARFLLVQLAVLAMDEDSQYPEDAPEEFKADKEGWCWMGQVGLSLKVGTDSDGRTVRNWITRFREDGVIEYRDWHDENGTLHAEYKVLESVVDAFQRPAKKADALAARTSRYKDGSRKANRGSFSTANQPGRTAHRRAIMEEDDE
jgi:hypothetical protein